MGGEHEVLELGPEPARIRFLLADTWRSRGLIATLARKSFNSRYRSAKLGVLWSVFLPMLQGAVLAVIFSRIVRVSVPYDFPVYVITGMVTWNVFVASFTVGSTAIIDGGTITTKIYFPRLIPPVVPTAASLPGYAISLLVVLGLMVVSDVPLRTTLLLLPVAAVVLTVFTGLLSAFVALLHVYFRDIRYVVQALVMVWFYATPIFYSLEMAGRFRPVLLLNPMTGIVQLTRYAVFGRIEGLRPALTTTAVFIAVLTLLVLALYARFDRVAVDRL